MTDLTGAVADFLAQKRLAVAGVSRDGDLPANHIYRKLVGAGYDVYPVNPKADEVEGVRCFPDLPSIPADIQGLVIASPPDTAAALVEECVTLGIPRVWMHRSFGQGSVTKEAQVRCQEAGIAFIPGACPMMYVEPVDVGHRCIRWILKVGGKLPSPEGFPPAG